ncbi:carboxyl-terminal processing protease [Ferrimonas sediminum]|uniref:Carboxyl-terminal processing protease n=2 Tax=Ferrimonas sediminum TaxID=718193 RepID=A0A1G8VYE5_9GAMM|nr:carboxyl-terminal processing protease [Ferrimonas sediminum]
MVKTSPKMTRLATWFAGALFSVQALALSPVITQDEIPVLAQEAQHKVASKRVTNLFSRSHYRKFAMDTEFSQQIFDRYLEQLDFNKSIFTQSEVDGFNRYRDGFAAAIQKGDMKDAYSIYQVALEKRYNRFSYALSLLDKPFDFDQAGDKYYFDREDAQWARSESDLDELWRQRVKNDALNLKLTGKEWSEIKEMLGKRYNNALKRLSQTHSEDVFQNVMGAFAYSIEPHTSYLSPRNADRFQTEMNLSLEGIGAVLQVRDDYTTIRSLVPGGPADSNGGLKPEDRITGVGQEGEEIVDVIGWRLDDVVELIKGPKGSKVTLEILPKKGGSNAKPKTVVIVRDKVKLEDRAVKSEVYVPSDGPYQGRRLGVIEIPSFYVNISQDVAKELEKLEAENVEAISIDLRNNGGGSLSEATLLTGLFISQGPVVQIRDQRGRININRDGDGRISYSGPMTVLVNRYSASASEIFAAAMQDYGRGMVIGEPTFGKGTVQQHRSLSKAYDLFEKPMGHVQYTIARFYRINGGSTQLKGVTPDIEYPSFFEPGEYGESQEDNALPWDSVPKAHYDTVNEVPKTMVSTLTANYLKRTDSNPEFGYLKEDISEYRAEKDKGYVSLVKSEREAKREADDATELKRTNERRKRQGLEPLKQLEDAGDDDEMAMDDSAEDNDYLLAESANITFDMVDWSRLAKQK